MKIAFAGSPSFAVPALKMLYAEGEEICAVLTNPDKPVGRKQILTPTPVKACAEELGLKVFDFKRVREHAEELKSLGAECLITCAYGQILTQEILDIFPRGVWNLHASLLPKFRGASPVQAAILAGEEHTGITVMKTELELDSGDILLVKRCRVGDKTCGELSDELSALAAEAAEEAMALIKRGEVQLLMQDSAKVSFCKKITKADAKIDFSQIAPRICRGIRAFSPSPAAHCTLNGTPVNIYNAYVGAPSEGAVGEVVSLDKRGIGVKCLDGTLFITEMQFAGGKRLKSADIINGKKIKAGDKFD